MAAIAKRFGLRRIALRLKQQMDGDGRVSFR